MTSTDITNLLDTFFSVDLPGAYGSEKPRGGSDTETFSGLLDCPYNLYVFKSGDGTVVGNRLRVLIAPLKKTDISVQVYDEDIEIALGTNGIPDTNVSLVHEGIIAPRGSWRFKLDENVDKDNIKASVADGLLTIDIPFKVEEKKPEEARPIPIE